MIRLVCPACSVFLPTALSSSGREVIASRRALGVCGAYKQAPGAGPGWPTAIGPPVVDQRDMARHESRAFEFLTGKARPSPLVLDLIKAVLTVRPVTVELPDLRQPVGRVAHQHRIFPTLDGFVLVNEVQFNLRVLAFALVVALALKHGIHFELAAHDDDAPLAAPAREAQVIATGTGGYLVLYRYDPLLDTAFVLTVCSQRERE